MGSRPDRIKMIAMTWIVARPYRIAMTGSDYNEFLSQFPLHSHVAVLPCSTLPLTPRQRADSRGDHCGARAGVFVALSAALSCDSRSFAVFYVAFDSVPACGLAGRLFP